MKSVTIKGYTVEYTKLDERRCTAKIFDFGVPIDERIVDIKYEDISKDASGNLVNLSLSQGA